MASFKQKAQTLMDTPQQILASVTLGLPAAVVGILPPVAGIKRNILKARQKAAGAMFCPTNLRDLLITDKYTYTVPRWPEKSFFKSTVVLQIIELLFSAHKII